MTTTLTLADLERLRGVAEKAKDWLWTAPSPKASPGYNHFATFDPPTALALLALAKEALEGRERIVQLAENEVLLRSVGEGMHDYNRMGTSWLATYFRAREAEAALAVAQAKAARMEAALKEIVNQALDIDGETRLIPDWKRSQKIALAALAPQPDAAPEDEEPGYRTQQEWWKLLSGRDKFIVEKGLFAEFVKSLSEEDEGVIALAKEMAVADGWPPGWQNFLSEAERSLKAKVTDAAPTPAWDGVERRKGQRRVIHGSIGSRDGLTEGDYDRCIPDRRLPTPTEKEPDNNG